MKHYLCLVYIVFLFYPVFSQFDTLSNTYLKENGYRLSNSIADYPKSLYPENAQYVVLGVRQTESKDILALLFHLNDTTFLQAPTLELHEKDAFDCDEENVIYEGGELKIECRWQRGLIYGTRFEVIDHRLYFQENYTYDLNEGVYIDVMDAQMNDDPIAYCIAYMGAQYYFQLIDIKIQESIEWAYQQASELAEKGAYIEAARLMNRLETECDLSVSQSVADLFPDGFKKIWCDAALFYLQADMNKECVSLSKLIVKFFPDCRDIHLHLGDALFNLGKISESKVVYTTYIQLMGDAGVDDLIPSRVTGRVQD